MEIFYKSAFKKFVKKQPRPFQLAIEDETDHISKNLEIGEQKAGDLAGFRVHKFILKKQKYLIAYKERSAHVVFYMIGTRENFYRELKRYIKEVE